MSDLDSRLLAAHERDDKRALVRLYGEAAEAAKDVDTCAFYLTHAHVFALELGLPVAEDLRAKLIALGREEPLPAATRPLR